MLELMADFCSRHAPPSLYNDPPDSPDHEMKLCKATSSDDCNQPPTINDWDGNVDDTDLKVYTQTTTEVGLPATPMETESNAGREQDWTNPIEELTAITRWDGMKSPKLRHTPNWCFPSPVKTRLPTPPAPEFPQCKFWKKANSIYARIFDYDKERIVAADTVDSGALFKVVKHGWDCLTPQERDNPVLQILEEVDQNLFWDLDPVTKIANLYKSHLILKVSGA